ncbi:MAG: hypothetical protein WBE76_27685 [Terracidiphilus sp.]
MAFTKPSVALGAHRLHYGTMRHTDTMEFLSPGVLISYRRRAAGAPAYPPANVKTALQAAAVQARNIVRIANDELAGVIFLRRQETALMTATLERHFNLSSTGGLGALLTDNVINKPFSLGALTQHDRRWYINKIREGILSLSFHLNTGMYIIDIDLAQRTIMGGVNTRPGPPDPLTGAPTTVPIAAGTAVGGGVRGYVHQLPSNLPCSFVNGEIHIKFEIYPGYTLNSGARIIIHEAAHKYLDIPDVYYAHSPNYPPTLQECLGNADSYAWTAVSLATGTLRMQTAASNDGQACPGPAL